MTENDQPPTPAPDLNPDTGVPDPKCPSRRWRILGVGLLLLPVYYLGALGAMLALSCLPSGERILLVYSSQLELLCAPMEFITDGGFPVVLQAPAIVVSTVASPFLAFLLIRAFIRAGRPS